MPLTDAKIRNARADAKPIKLTDGGGLFLLVKPNGSKLWRYRFRLDGKENTFAIGDYYADRRHGHVSLEQARAERDRARAMVKRGANPSHERQSEKLALRAAAANTFKAVAEEWIAANRARWTPYYLGQVESFLEADAYPRIGTLPVRNITPAHIQDLLKRIVDRGAPSVAILVRQWTSAIFRFAIASLRAEADPTWALKGGIQRPKVQHHRPLNRDEIARLLAKLDGFAGYRTTVIALRLMLLTFVRTVELRCANWSEFDLSRAEWRIPAERMKMRSPHIVPLSRQAVELLRELHRYTGGRPMLFPNYRRSEECMTATTLNRALERLGFNGQGSIGFSAQSL